MQDDIEMMQRALGIARDVASKGGKSAIGCVIVRDGKVIGQGSNEVGPRCDATAHAEIVAMRMAGQTLQDASLEGATLYTTLQPCGMCSMASIWAKIGRIVYGAGREDVHKMYFEDRHLNVLDIINDAYRDDLKLTPRVLAKECATLYHAPGDVVPAAEQGNI